VAKAVEEPLRGSISIITDFPPAELVPANERGESPTSKRRKLNSGIASLDVDYVKQEEYIKKAKEMIDFEREGACSVCHKDLEHDAGIYTICPNPGCETVTHMTCLSDYFLKEDKDSLVPISGTCPGCKTELRWIDIVKELSLRMRGQKEVMKLLKARKIRKGKATASQSVVESEDDENDEDVEADIYGEIKAVEELNPKTSKTNVGDRWHAIDDSEDSDASWLVSTASQSKKAVLGLSKAGKADTLATVIEDSDWDDALVLD
jgi:structure-specific endonuclease subunit SLX1